MKVIPLEHLEEEFANLLEEKQLELIRYPAKREKYAISFRTDVEDGIHSFFFYSNAVKYKCKRKRVFQNNLLSLQRSEKIYFRELNEQ